MVSTVSAASSVVYVNGSHGNDSWSGTSWATAKLTIKNATGTVANGGTVNIANGVYSGTKNTKITIEKNMTIRGQSKNSTIINGKGTWIFSNPKATVTIYNLTIKNATESFTDNFGVISNNGTMTVNNCILKDNHGLWFGTIFNTGKLNVINSDFTGNSVDGLTTTSASYPGSSGGAITNTGNSICSVIGSTFTNNYAGCDGGAIYNYYGNLTVKNSAFKNNTANLGGAIYNDWIAAVNFNQIIGNSTNNDIFIDYNGLINSENNWWGSNAGPLNTINIKPVKWLILKITASQNLVKINGTSTITVDLTHDSAGVYHNPTYGHVPDGIPVAFTKTLGTISNSYTVNGIAKAIFKGGLTSGIATISAKVNNQTVKTSVTVDATIPTVKSIDPVNNALNVPRYKTIKITFSEPVKAGSNYWIELKNSNGTLIPITKSISGNILTISHSALLAKGVKYTLILHTGCVTDSAGNSLALRTFSFTTSKI